MFPNNSSVTRPLPSLLPGSDGTPSPAFHRYYAAAKTTVVARPTLRFQRCAGRSWVDFAGSLTGAGKSAAPVPGCWSPVSPAPVFGPKETYGTPKFPANPSDLCHALGPRSALCARSLCGAQAWPPQLLRRRHQPVMTFGALSHSFGHRCLRFVPSSRTTTQNSLPVADRPFRVGFSMPT